MKATATCQIRRADDQHRMNELVVHVAGEFGLPACGTLVRPWAGHRMVAVALGPGEVTCLNPGCAL
jgi:hypothetical protein